MDSRLDLALCLGVVPRQESTLRECRDSATPADALAVISSPRHRDAVYSVRSRRRLPQSLGSAAEVEFIGSPFTELPRLALYELRVS